MSEAAAQWNAIDNLMLQAQAQAEVIAVIKHEQETQRRIMGEQHAAIIHHIAGVSAKIDTMAIDVHEARGGIRLGKWLVGIGLTVLGLAIAVLALFMR